MRTDGRLNIRILPHLHTRRFLEPRISFQNFGLNLRLKLETCVFKNFSISNYVYVLRFKSVIWGNFT